MSRAKPKMSQQEASFHTTQAGSVAAASAAQSDNQVAIDALDHSTAPFASACGWLLKPLTMGTSIAFQKLAKACHDSKLLDALDEDDSQLIQGLLCELCFADPRRLRDTLASHGLAALIAEANRIIDDEPLEARLELSKHFQAVNNIYSRLNAAAAPLNNSDPTAKNV